MSIHYSSINYQKHAINYYKSGADYNQVRHGLKDLEEVGDFGFSERVFTYGHGAPYSPVAAENTLAVGASKTTWRQTISNCEQQLLFVFSVCIGKKKLY